MLQQRSILGFCIAAASLLTCLTACGNGESFHGSSSKQKPEAKPPTKHEAAEAREADETEAAEAPERPADVEPKATPALPPSETARPEPEAVPGVETAPPPPEAVRCIEAPGALGTIEPAAPGNGSLVRTDVFHATAALDRPKADAALASSSFSLTSATLVDLIEKDHVEAIEWLAFAHEFGYGTDYLEFAVELAKGTVKAKSIPSVYSAHGYVSIVNLRVEAGIPLGDVHVLALGYQPGNTILGPPDSKDGTKVSEPAYPRLTPTKSLKDVDLSTLKVKIGIGAEVYDSTQFRAVRQVFWAAKPVALPAKCD